jgi:hypothetical protein
MDSLDTAKTRMFRRVGDDWVKLVHIDLSDDFYPLFVKPDGGLIARSARGRDKTALVLSRFSSGLFRAMFAMKERTNGKEIHR